MKKREIKGWIGKTWKFNQWDGDVTYMNLPPIVLKKAKKSNWPKGEWPPKRVKITIEYETRAKK